MFSFRKKPQEPEKPPAPERTEERRKAPRYETVVVSSTLGDLWDLSRLGARVQQAGSPTLKPGDTVEIELSSPTDSVWVKARVVRLAAVARGRCEIGLSFVDLSADQAEQVENLARHGTTKGKRAAGPISDSARKLVAALRMPDHYAALGLSPSASHDDIHKAFRALARRCHPDISSDPASARMFCAINDAHRVLGDPERREAYDRQFGLRSAA